VEVLFPEMKNPKLTRPEIEFPPNKLGRSYSMHRKPRQRCDYSQTVTRNSIFVPFCFRRCPGGVLLGGEAGDCAVESTPPLLFPLIGPPPPLEFPVSYPQVPKIAQSTPGMPAGGTSQVGGGNGPESTCSTKLPLGLPPDEHGIRAAQSRLPLRVIGSIHLCAFIPSSRSCTVIRPARV